MAKVWESRVACWDTWVNTLTIFALSGARTETANTVVLADLAVEAVRDAVYPIAGSRRRDAGLVGILVRHGGPAREAEKREQSFRTPTGEASMRHTFFPIGAASVVAVLAIAGQEVGHSFGEKWKTKRHLGPRKTTHCGGNIVSCDVARPWCAPRTQEMFLKIFRNIFLCPEHKICVRKMLRAWQNESTFEKHDHVSNVVATKCPRFAGLLCSMPLCATEAHTIDMPSASQINSLRLKLRARLPSCFWFRAAFVITDISDAVKRFPSSALFTLSNTIEII